MSKKRCKLVEFTWFSFLIRVSSFLFSFRSKSQSCEWNKLITPAMSLHYSDVFSDFPEILRSRSRDLKLPSLPFGVVACAFASTSSPKRLHIFIWFSFWLYLLWLLSVTNGAVVHAILQLCTWLPSLWTGVRLRMTLLWYKRCCFSNANYFVIMLTRYQSLSQHGHLQPHSKSKAWQLTS